ncbi:glycosyltransferase 87 family protein [Yinghuangia seranimata]|uniref:glycosyltransferase 87 family protein n=1 Tax=Yinghuangia seranimata TaxID=408067 RepID=UPI00248CEC3A|nr:glycosyltransferase 87 family protein [Yinghuangia seranimata]MDI2132605.1 glycosyltransferase 87 family protein [Yinghuangia seranimata]
MPAATQPGNRPGKTSGTRPGETSEAHRPKSPETHLATALAVLLVVLQAAVLAYAVHGAHTRSGDYGTYVVYAVAWSVFAVAAWLTIRRVPRRAAVPLILLGAVAFQLIALSAPPQTSDDAYRYAWDGRVQAAGISPYRYTPQDPALERLRDDWLFPPPEQGPCVGWFKHPLPDGACTLMNRPAVHTIYPPVAQAWYRLVHAATPSDGREPVQAAAALTAIAVTLALLWLLRRIGRDPRHVVLWAWCPMVALECGNNAHVDALGVFFLVLGLGAVAAKRPLLGGLLAGAAIATKMFPAASLVGAARRRPWLTWGTAAATVLLSYVPYLLISGSAVIGYLPGYLKEEDYNDGARFGLLDLVLPEAATPFAAVAVLVVTAVVVSRRSDPDRPWHAALTMTGTLLLVLAPNYPWYSLILVALVVLDGRAEWLAVGLAGYALYFTWMLGITDTQMAAVHHIAYGAALAVVVSTAALRGRRTRMTHRQPECAAEPVPPSEAEAVVPEPVGTTGNPAARQA